ncbi:hypothetical protein A2121_00935 [Candidatus Nomurabacteria bacterium GWB1_40_6]|uniref:Nudix hydrolase domain-containing protein n=1 Tax=Candidatus Nomurabacteria bacterium GWB1_40_6 TaxID=1801727 RepID=A0A1F6TK72_9BACT|nr:MAG: hypothetical protein A2121_00935 [Candidatus Nomurabacteria bacterium GWB1_40_6]
MRVPIVDENDIVLYYKDRKDRDLRKEISRSSAIWITNEKGDILIAKRSKNKVNFPNIWGPSAAGTVEEGESYESNIIKEVKEEIGIELDNLSLGPKERESDNHEFFGQYFFSKISSNTKFILQESEVDEVRWISLGELEKWYMENPKDFIVSFNVSLKVIKNYTNQS